MVQSKPSLLARLPMRRAALAMALLLLLATTGAFSWLSWRHEAEQQQHFQESMVEIGARALDTYFSGMERALETAGQQILGGSGGRATDAAAVEAASPRILQVFKRRHPEMQIAMLVALDGRIIATSEGVPYVPLPNEAIEPSFVEARGRLAAGENLVIGRPMVGTVTKLLVTPVRYALRDKQGRLLYVLAVGLPLSQTLSFWKDAPTPARTTLSLLRDDGYLVARYPVQDKSTQEQPYARPQDGALMGYLKANLYPASGMLIGSGRVSGDGGGAVLVFKRLANHPLTFYSRNPRRNLLAAWWEEVWFTYLLMGLLVAGGIAIHAWSTARQAQWDRQQSRHIYELEAANQALASFTYTISHDLRGPLRAIDGFAALHREELQPADTSPSTHFIDRIRDSATRMERLIDGLLEFSRQSQVPLNPRRVDMGELVRSVLAGEIPASSAALVRVGPLPIVEADPALLRTVWKHLIANAVKFSRQSAAPLIEIGCGDGACFVRDNGAGFDMAHADKLFGVFSRLHPAAEFDGTGVSLAIVRRIVERHGGRIWATGKPGQGAEFRFVLP